MYYDDDDEKSKIIIQMRDWKIVFFCKSITDMEKKQ